MFPKNRVKLSLRIKTGVDALGDDVFNHIDEIISGAMVTPESTTDQPEPHELNDLVIVQLHLPKSFTKSVAGGTFVPLNGSFKDRIFKVRGDSVAYDFSPLSWNRFARAEEIYR